MTAAPVAIIAGAGGAGAAAAASMAEAGYYVVVLNRQLDDAKAVSDALVADGHPAEAHSVDLLDADAVAQVRDDLVSRLGRIDVLVHLVGGWRGSPTLDRASVDNWIALSPPIVGTLAVLTAVFVDDIRRSDVGRVFMVTSTAAAKPTGGNIAYASAKAAAEAWMLGVAHVLRDSAASSVTVVVKALLTDEMTAAEPEKAWPGYTHVRVLAEAIAAASTSPAGNGSRLDLTAEYSGT